MTQHVLTVVIAGVAADKAGLSMPGRRAPLDVIVVDSINKAPTEN